MPDPTDLHVTLAYFGDAAPLDEQKDTVIETLRTFAANEPPFDGKINGIGRFMDADPNPFYANFDSPALPAFRQRLLDALQVAGLSPDQTHGYTPHITLAYIRQDAETPPVTMQQATPATFDHITLAWGDERIDLPLAGQPIKSLDRPIAFGSAIKSLGNGRVGGYLVAYGGKDLEGEYFTPETEFCLDWYAQRPCLYHHGFDSTLKATAIGIIDMIKADEIGLWAEAQLDLHNQYLEAVQALIDKGVLGWSSGALPQGVDKDYDGRIKCWPLIEGSLTPTPAEFQRTRVTTLKAYLASLEESSGTAKAGDVGQDAAGDNQPSDESQAQTTEKGTKRMDEQMMAALISAVAEALGMQLNEEDLARLTEQVKPIYAQYEQQEAPAEGKAEGDPPEEDMAQKAIHDPKFLQAVAAVVRGINKPSKQAIKDAVKATIAGAPGQSKVNGFRAPNGGNPHISGMLDQRFDHLKAHEAALAIELLRSMKKTPSEDLRRAAAYKTAQQVERNDVAATDLAVKSVFSFTKANEVMQSTLAGYGDEWAGVFWNTQQWLAVRQETPIYERMIALGMEERELPQGFESETIPLESTDPTWYVAAGATAEDSNTGLPTPTFNSTKYGTGQKSVTVAKLSARLDYQKELEEDSIVQIAPDANRKLTVSAKEQIEYILLCGDTATGANTNINLIDGTPAAAPAKPSYTLLDGILKLALVTNTANSRDASTSLTEADFLALLPMLGVNGKLAADLNRIMFVVDNMTYFAALQIALLKSHDVFANATIEKGVLERIWGVEVLRSGQMPLANSAGKIPAAGGTLGRIALIRPDQWTTRWKRKLDMFTTYYPTPDVTQVVAHMRWGLAYRDNEASAVSYNVPVTIS